MLSKQTLDLFLKQKNLADLIGLYCFYYYTAKWQQTNQPKATTGYAAKGLKWGIQKIQKHKKIRELSRAPESSEQFVWLNRRYGETGTQLSRSAIMPSIRADSSQNEVI